MVRKSRKLPFSRQTALLSAAGLVVVAAIGLGTWHFHSRSSTGTIPSTPNQSTLTKTNNSSQASDSSSGSDKQVAPPSQNSNNSTVDNPIDSTGQPPAVPYGQFVSSHHADQNTAEQSACTTTPGASCYIKLTKGNDSQTLQAQLTDANGAAIWNWSTSSLSPGSWQITAVATLNSQTKSATDAMALTIQ